MYSVVINSNNLENLNLIISLAKDLEMEVQEKDDLAKLSIKNLQRAFEDDEVEYFEEDVILKNPEFREYDK
jgi:hypothetical protein